jgi:chromosome condensin MukBEF ATPase and DNA-binding subunit MukB
MYPIHLNPVSFEKDPAHEIARIANDARELGRKLRKDNRDMTKQEAYRQLGHSASLLKAILGYVAQISLMNNSQSDDPYAIVLNSCQQSSHRISS